MVASKKIGISIPLLLRDPQSLLILGIFRTKFTEEALWIIQDVILSLDRDKYWWFALTVPDAVTAASVSRYPSTWHDFFKDPI